MSKPRTRPRGKRRRRIARWLGLDHNPLRRPADRLEAWLQLIVITLMLTAAPIAAIMCGLVANHVLARQALAEQRSDRVVTAVLAKKAPTSTVDPYVADPEVWAQARWTAPDGATRSGQILARAGTPAGGKVDIWVNTTGETVDPPAQHQTVVIGAITVGVIGGLFVDLILMGTDIIIRRTLDRRRLAAWDSEWRAIGPLWSHHN